MAVPLIDTLFDLLSATSGALVGAIVTGLFNRGRRKQLSDQVVLGRQELEKLQLENDRLLEMIKDKESTIQDKQNTIIEMQMQILGGCAKKSPSKKAARKKQGK